MKRFLPFIVLLLVAAGLAAKIFFPPKDRTMGHTQFLGMRLPAEVKSPFALDQFAQLPVLADGRIKPLDTVARTSLLILQNRQRVIINAEGDEITPTEWLLDAFFKSAETTDTYRSFVIDDPDVLAIFGRDEKSTAIRYDSTVMRFLAIAEFVPTHQRRFSYAELRDGLSELEKQSQLAQQTDEQARTPFQRAVVKLHSSLVLYNRIKFSLQSADGTDFLQEVTDFGNSLNAGIEAVQAQRAGKPHDNEAFKAMETAVKRYDFMSQVALIRPIPPDAPTEGPSGWKNIGASLLETFSRRSISPEVLAFAALGESWRLQQPETFNKITQLYSDQLNTTFPKEVKKARVEAEFNHAEVFYQSMTLYAYAFLLVLIAWLRWPELLGRTAFYLLGLAWVLATGGILARMWLEGRPPVTNLYSSAVFVGWGAVALCLILERVFRNGVATLAGAMIGFATLLIAHHLSLSGDTLEMMRAVLDSNFWLGTHVVVVTTGYAATFLSGFLAIVYIVRGVFTRSLDEQTAKALTKMVYGIVCFATLFSLVGTILGGIWADQSWGRFWGWDPKENGALIIVIWNAVILHCRWGGMVKARGLMALAVFGNIVTSWSWFGVNMLGVGLHSYGFMEAAFWWLIAFVVTQLLIIALALRPMTTWRSFKPVPTAS